MQIHHEDIDDDRKLLLSLRPYDSSE